MTGAHNLLLSGASSLAVDGGAWGLDSPLFPRRPPGLVSGGWGGGLLFAVRRETLGSNYCYQDFWPITTFLPSSATPSGGPGPRPQALPNLQGRLARCRCFC